MKFLKNIYNYIKFSNHKQAKDLDIIEISFGKIHKTVFNKSAKPKSV